MTVYQENGNEYHGRLVNGLKHDPNDATLSYDGFLYKGPFKNDMRHGATALVQSVGSPRYLFTGSYSNDKKQGMGQLTVTDPHTGHPVEKYQGMYKNDQFHGSGVHSNKDGDHYDGEFANGKREGVGKLKQTTSGFVLSYIGDFKANKFDGHGQLEIERKDEEPRVLSPNLSIQPVLLYNGTFKDGKKDGHGELLRGAIVITDDQETSE